MNVRCFLCSCLKPGRARETASRGTSSRIVLIRVLPIRTLPIRTLTCFRALTDAWSDALLTMPRELMPRDLMPAQWVADDRSHNVISPPAGFRDTQDQDDLAADMDLVSALLVTSRDEYEKFIEHHQEHDA